MVLLINPPVVKPCEPPPGIALIGGALRANGVRCTLWDANLECMLELFRVPKRAEDRWTARAARNVEQNLNVLRSMGSYGNGDRYRRAVSDLNRLLSKPCFNGAAQISLTNYQDRVLSPLRSRDLLAAAEFPEKNAFFPFFSESLVSFLERENPSLVGISLNYLSQALPAFAMMGFLRRMDTSLTLVLGGGLITSWMSAPGWKDPFEGLVDHTIAGPGERSLLSLVLGSDLDPDSHRCDYGALPSSDYLAPGLILPYSASTGCYWNRCAFCPEIAEKTPYVPLPVGRVTEDLERLAQDYSPVLIHLLDNAISPALMDRLIMHPPGVPWYGFARFSDQLADGGACMELKRSGCVMLQVGLESGDQNVLDREQKGISLTTASRALKTLSRNGIGTYVYLLFGTPSENQDAARKTLDFTAAHSEYIDFLNLALFNLPRFSPEAARVETRAFSEGDLSLYSSFIHPHRWDRARVRQFLDKEFKRHPAIAPILRRDPPFFTSNHAPFFCMKTAPVIPRVKPGNQ